MDFDLQKLMAQATQLTRQGRLADATSLLRSAMGGAAPAASAPVGAARANTAYVTEAAGAADVIDVAARRVDAAASTGSTFTTHGFANAADRRDYRLFVPAGPHPTPMPLVVMLHGCTQDPDDFAAGTRMNVLAQSQGFVVMYPAQSRKANPQGCWNWFKHTHQTRDRGEPALIAGMVRQVMAAQPIDPQRVYVAGLSAGGAMAAILGETHPDLFAAVGVHSGLAAGSATDLPSAMAAMKDGAAARRGAAGRGSGKPTIVFHGDADPTVDIRNARHVISASVGAAGSAAGEASKVPGTRAATREIFRGADGQALAELWVVHGARHAWSGGGAGSHTDPSGPDASAEMLRFFLQNRLP